MKKLIVLTTMTVITSNFLNAQTWDEWFEQKKTKKKYLIEQIAALEVYLGYVKKGYKIAQAGLNLIGDIKEGNFKLHKDYFESLEFVNPLIKESSKAAYAIALHHLIKYEIESQYSRCRNNENFTGQEVRYLSSVYSNIENISDKSYSELLAVLTDHELKMQDDERLKNIDRIQDNMKDVYAFLRSFNPLALAMQRENEHSELTLSRKLNLLQP